MRPLRHMLSAVLALAIVQASMVPCFEAPGPRSETTAEATESRSQLERDVALERACPCHCKRGPALGAVFHALDPGLLGPELEIGTLQQARSLPLAARSLLRTAPLELPDPVPLRTPSIERTPVSARA